MKKYIILAILVVILGGCARTYIPPKSYSFIKTKKIATQYDAVWQKLTQWVALNNYKITTIDKNTGIMTFEVVPNDKICDCGAVTRWDDANYDVLKYHKANQAPTGFVSIIIEKHNNEFISITINNVIKCTVTTYFDTNPEIKDCNSTGVLEKQIFDYLETGDKISNSGK